MDKKKLIGLVIFIVMLGLLIKYPDIQEYRLQRSISAMIQKGQYQRALDSINREDIKEFNFYYMSVVKCEIGLGMPRAEHRINKLIREKETDLIQDLVNSMGVNLGHYLIEIDNQISDLTYSDDLREHIAQIQYAQGNEGRAMYLRGVEEVNAHFLQYLYRRGNFYDYIKFYDKVPEYLKPLYTNQMCSVLILQLFIYYHEESEEKATQFLDDIESIEHPREFLKSMAAYSSFLERCLENEDLEQNDLSDKTLSHSFFKENPYYGFFNTLFMVSDPKTREEAIKELKENPQFAHIEKRDELIKIVEDSTLVNHMDQVTKGNILFYSDVYGKNRYYDLINETDLDLEDIWISRISPNRDYLVYTAYAGDQINLKVLNSSMNNIWSFENIELAFWIDNESFVFFDYSSEGDWETRQFNMESKKTSDYEGDYDGNYLSFVPQGGSFRLWSFDDTTYTIIESELDIDTHQSFSIPGRKYYTTKTIEKHEEIASIEFDFIFLGSTPEYIYGTDLGVINVMVRMEKSTGEITRLPFYSIFSWGNNIKYLDNYYFW